MSPNVDNFYRADDAPLQQGDVVLAPTVRLVAGDSAPSTGPYDQVVVDVAAPARELHGVRASVGWGSLVVVSHDCRLDKDFNRRYRQLRDAGQSKRAAIAAAEADPSLDRWLCVAPMHNPLEGVDGDDAPAVAAAHAVLGGAVVGWFPLPALPDAGLTSAMAADLTWLATIERSSTVARVASLTEPARTSLGLALARSAALRTPELGFILEDIVGDRIDAARGLPGDPLGIELDLRKTGTVRLPANPQ